MQQATLVETLVPASSRAGRMGLALSGSLFIALCSQVTIPLPFTPVPLTGQTFGVLLTALLLGRSLATWSVGVYLAGGAVGLPVFAGFSGGWGHLIGPTGGYLFGFLLAAVAVGWLAERGWDRRIGTCLLAMLLGEVLIYLPGLLMLSRFVPSDKLLMMGLIPFIPGDLIKIGGVALALPGGWKLVHKDGDRT